MTHFGFFFPPATGHLDPMSALGRVLLSRGHRVSFFQIPDLEQKVRKEGLPYVPIGVSEFPPGTHGQVIARLGEMTGLSGVRFSIECGRRLIDMVCRDAPDAVRSAGVDFLIVDQNEPAAASVAEHLNLPFVSICTSLPINREPAIPPPFMTWPYNPRWVGVLRNKAGYAIADWLLKPFTNALNGHRQRWGLPPVRSPNDTFSRLAQISQTVPEIDFPRHDLPSTFHYVGPFCRSEHTEIAFPFDRLDCRPIVYASFGTLQNRQSKYFRWIAEACAPLEVQLVMTLGNMTVRLNDLPGDPIVVPYAPQLALLARAAVVITHAGTNTTLGALTFGLPMVAIPVTTDQAGTAARIAYSGAGEMLPLHRLSPEALRAKLMEVMTVPRYRAKAQRIQQSIASVHGAVQAADIIETVSGPSHNEG